MNSEDRNDDVPLRVLLIEDNELDALVMMKHLRADPESDFEVIRVGDLATAVRMLEDAHFDCLLLDLSLPDSSGLVSVDVLTSQAPNCPIVVLTGLDDPSTALEAMEQGAQDYLSKQSAEPGTVARSIRYAIARLHSEVALRYATDQLSLLRDRERIGRDLHDTVIQQLFATGIGLQSVLATIADPVVLDRVETAVDGIDSAIRQLREAIFGLHAIPRTVALAQAIDDLADDKAMSLGFRPLVEVGPMPEDLAPSIEREVVHVVTEALANVAKHAKASATKVIIEIEDDSLVATVTDNGRGLVDDSERSESDFTGNGLVNMEKRATELAGRFHIGVGPGGGCQIRWSVPVDRPGRPAGRGHR